MSVKQGYYALLQFSAAPERYEYVNIGVALFSPSDEEVFVRFSSGLRRVERLFGKQPAGYFNILKVDFQSRLSQFKSANFESLEKFAKSRANKIRIASIQPFLIERDPNIEISGLFDLLVGEDESGPRRQRVAAELKSKFEVAGVDLFLEKPAPVTLPQGVTLEVPYAYQNGAYNLIEPVRLNGDAANALAQASERAVKGQWLWQYSKQQGSLKQLIVVGDFSSTEGSFRSAVSQMMREHSVRLYDLDEVDPLVEDIRRHGHIHASN
jgi:hypothetical protein